MPAVNEDQHDGVLLVGGAVDCVEGARGLLGLPEPAFVVGLDEMERVPGSR